MNLPVVWVIRHGEVSSFADKLLKIENALVPNCMKAFVGTFGSPAITWPLELLTRGFASLPFDSFALSLVKLLKLLNNIIEHFEDGVKYYIRECSCRACLADAGGLRDIQPNRLMAT